MTGTCKLSPLWQAVLINGTGGAVARLCRAALRAQRFSRVPHAAAPGPAFQGLRRPGTARRGAPVPGDGAASALIACNGALFGLEPVPMTSAIEC